MHIRDIRGKVFDATRVPQRILSLVPSMTEVVFALGAGNRIALEVETVSGVLDGH